MPWSRLRLIAAVSAVCLAGCAGLMPSPPPQKDYVSLSLRLHKDMSEQDVTTTLGAPPDKADMVTCTDHDGNPWQCKTWIYSGERPKNNLRLVFYQADDKAWRVVAWQLY
jgi:hypothetical protein